MSYEQINTFQQRKKEAKKEMQHNNYLNLVKYRP